MFGLIFNSAASRSEEFHFIEVMTPERVQTLLECLTDTFEANKIEAYSILSGLPPKYLMLQAGGTCGVRTVRLRLTVKPKHQAAFHQVPREQAVHGHY